MNSWHAPDTPASLGTQFNTISIVCELAVLTGVGG